MSFDNIIEFLEELEDDSTIPKNVKMKITTVVQILKGEGEDNIKRNKALDELDELSNDANMQSFTRTQIWNVVSMLENA